VDARATVSLALRRLNEDELEVLAEVAQGLLRGQDQYGPLDLDRDGRDFQRETLDEVRDGLVYVGVQLVQARRRVG